MDVNITLHVVKIFQVEVLLYIIHILKYLVYMFMVSFLLLEYFCIAVDNSECKLLVTVVFIFS